MPVVHVTLHVCPSVIIRMYRLSLKLLLSYRCCSRQSRGTSCPALRQQCSWCSACASWKRTATKNSATPGCSKLSATATQLDAPRQAPVLAGLCRSSSTVQVGCRLGDRRPAPSSAAGVRAPPPGFAHATASRMSAMSSPGLQQQQQAVPGAGGPCLPPMSGGQLGPHALAQEGSSNNYASQSSMHSVDSNSSLFSQGSTLSQSVLWTDTGLTGLDFGGTPVPGLGSGLATGAMPAVPPRLQMLWAGSASADSGINPAMGSQQQGVGNSFGEPRGMGGSLMGSGCMPPAPPPGFGGSLHGSRLTSSYNPLAASGLAPPGFGFGGLGADTDAHGSWLKQQQGTQHQDALPAMAGMRVHDPSWCDSMEDCCGVQHAANRLWWCPHAGRHQLAVVFVYHMLQL